MLHLQPSMGERQGSFAIAAVKTNDRREVFGANMEHSKQFE
jgi:hypothetical protein